MFIAYGVAMAGIGMLTLTGNTISMDVFGPVADNANGIGEMGYNKEPTARISSPASPATWPEDYKRARQILADLDAVGNTTKAETKGIAIGSAVIAAVSMFASFIATLAMGSEDQIVEDDDRAVQQVRLAADRCRADGASSACLIGGVVPWLFSSMLIRAVGRAAFYIIKECRIQFRDKEIWAGTKKPNYARVVDICTNAAQAELIGPALAGRAQPDPRRRAARTLCLGRLPGRHDRLGRDARGLHGQRRRRLGQCQEDDRGRAAGPGPQPRQGLARSTRRPSPAIPSATR